MVNILDRSIHNAEVTFSFLSVLSNILIVFCVDAVVAVNSFAFISVWIYGTWIRRSSVDKRHAVCKLCALSLPIICNLSTTQSARKEAKTMKIVGPTKATRTTNFECKLKCYCCLRAFVRNFTRFKLNFVCECDKSPRNRMNMSQIAIDWMTDFFLPFSPKKCAPKAMKYVKMMREKMPKIFVPNRSELCSERKTQTENAWNRFAFCTRSLCSVFNVDGACVLSVRFVFEHIEDMHRVAFSDSSWQMQHRPPSTQHFAALAREKHVCARNEKSLTMSMQHARS